MKTHETCGRTIVGFLEKQTQRERRGPFIIIVLEAECFVYGRKGVRNKKKRRRCQTLIIIRNEHLHLLAMAGTVIGSIKISLRCARHVF